MPKILDDTVRQLQKKGFSKSSSFAIGTSTLQKAGELRKGSNKPTALGVKRGSMSQKARRANPP